MGFHSLTVFIFSILSLPFLAVHAVPAGSHCDPLANTNNPLCTTSTSHAITVVASLGICVCAAAIIIAAILFARKRRLARIAAASQKDPGYQTTYWTEANAPKSHPFMLETQSDVGSDATAANTAESAKLKSIKTRLFSQFSRS